MHPKRKKELQRHCPSVKQVHTTKKQAKRFLYQLAANDQSCPGVFGWTWSFLMPMRGKENVGKRTTFINQMARLVARIANAKVPDIVGFILTCGGLFALNKLNPDDQNKQVSSGQQPKFKSSE